MARTDAPVEGAGPTRAKLVVGEAASESAPPRTEKPSDSGAPVESARSTRAKLVVGKAASESAPPPAEKASDLDAPLEGAKPTRAKLVVGEAASELAPPLTAKPSDSGAPIEGVKPTRAKRVIGGAAADAQRPSRAKLVVGGAAAEIARPSRGRLVIGGGAAAGPGAQVTTRSETLDLALEPGELPTQQVTMPGDLLGPLPGPLKRHRRPTPWKTSGLVSHPGEIDLGRLPPEVIVRAHAKTAGAEAEETRQTVQKQAPPLLGPEPVSEAPWLADPVRPEERLTATQLARMVPIWVWILLGLGLIATLALLVATEPSDSRTLPSDMGTIPEIAFPERPRPVP